jgi:hypothetical protein
LLEGLPWMPATTGPLSASLRDNWRPNYKECALRRVERLDFGLDGACKVFSSLPEVSGSDFWPEPPVAAAEIPLSLLVDCTFTPAHSYWFPYCTLPW